MSNDRYWLDEWIDEQGVDTPEDAERALATGALERALQLAEEQAPTASYPDASTGNDVVAGRALDLSGMQSCNNPGCLVKQVEELFTRAWLYFDTITVEALGANRFLALPGERRIEEAAKYARLLLYLRKAGAERYLRFAEKPHSFCADHYREHAEEIGVPSALDSDAFAAVVSDLTERGGFERFDVGSTTLYGFVHPDLEIVQLVARPRGDEPDVAAVAKGIAQNFCLNAVGDVALAKSVHAPLLSTVSNIMAPKRIEAGFDDLTLKVRMPILEGASLFDILELRNRYASEFEMFRASLKAAISERLANSPGANPEEVARQVMTEHVSPAVAELEVKLSSARRTLAKTSGSSVAAGTILASVGLLFGMPLLIPAGIAAAATAVSQINKYFDARREVELSDMYFLWQAEGHRGAH